ncbi:hypothetical protein LUZ60_009706 [Juncus effusus]|nr:hypothetical protein LUZ60_009706 [Juncus effusus]
MRALLRLLSMTTPPTKSPRLLNLARQLRLYKAPPSSLDIADDDEPAVDARGKVFAPLAVAESAAPSAISKPERFVPKTAAVLICLFEDPQGDLRVVLTKRSSNLSSHSGEVSLPGGKTEEGDEDEKETAMREAKEEIGLEPNLVSVVAVLEPFLSKHLLRVSPVIGILYDKDAFKPVLNRDEVEEIFDAPLEMFLKDENRRFEEREWLDAKYLVHYFDFTTENKSFVIWGLTASILIRAASVVYKRPPSFAEQYPKFRLPKSLKGDDNIP